MRNTSGIQLFVKSCVVCVMLLLDGCISPGLNSDTEPLLPSVSKTWQGERAKLVILGSTRARSLQGSEWDDIRIGMGVSALLAQALYDTGCFSLVEAAPEVRERMAQLSSALWAGDGAVSSALDAIDADYAASVSVTDFQVTDVSAFLGIAGMGRKNTTIRVVVELRNLRTGGKSRASGKGAMTTGNTGVLFLYESGTVEFDQTTVGRATKAAIYDAVSRLNIP